MKFLWMSMLLPLLAGCGIFSAAPTTVLNEKNNGEAITVAEGEKIVIALESNPTTGYQWKLFNESSTSLPVLQEEGETFIPPNTNRVGAPGEVRFHLKAVNPGDAVVSCYYYRPWEQFDPATDTKVEYRIEVK